MISTIFCASVFTLGFTLSGAAGSSESADLNWPNWRGPDANGSLGTGKYPARWDADRALWKVALPGKGSSTPIVLRGRIYLTAPLEGQDALMAFDLAGKQLWQTRLGPESRPKHRTLGSSCNASPVIDGERIYVYFRSGLLAALDLDGAIRWTTNLAERFGQERLFWDQGSSPVLTEEHLILTRMHGGDSWVAGFDKTTGELRWQESRNYRVPSENDNAYTTPVLYTENGQQAFLVWGGDHLTAHRAADGKRLWECGGFNPDGVANWPAIATPLIVKDLAIVPVGRDDRRGQSRVHAIRLGGSGDVTDSHRAWKREDIGVFVSTPAEFEGRVYLLRHRGELVCLDPATGKTIWADSLPRSNSSYYASPVIGNGVLYAAREDGVVFAGRVGEKFELLSTNPMGERIIASPVPVGGRLLLRGDRHLFCIGQE